MGLETGDQIGDLVPANPPGSDPKAQGDDHLRLIKTCVQGSLGLMIDFWTIPTVGPGLRQRNSANDGDINLINFLSGDLAIEIGEAGVLVAVFDDFQAGGSITGGTIRSIGQLTVDAGGANITGTLTLDGQLNVLNNGITSAGLITVIAGGVTLQADDLTVQLGNVIANQGGYNTTMPSDTAAFSVKMNRSGANAGNMMQTENNNAAATYRPLGTFEHRDNGDIGIGNTTPLSNDFVITETSIRLANMPTSSAGLQPGELFNQGGFVHIV